MSSFFGSETSILDAKGRITVPARLRKGIRPESGSDVMLVRGIDGVVSLYPQDEWVRYTDHLRNQSMGDDVTRAVFLTLSETAYQTVIDGAGRVQLTPELIAIAGLEREARLVGVVDHVEIWEPARFAAQIKKASSNFEEMLKGVFNRKE